MNQTVKIKLIKSLNGRLKAHKATARGLGLKKINQEVVLQNTPSIQGMIDKIKYLLKIGD